MRIKAAWLLLSLSSALSLPAGIAIAQDGTVVPKSPPTTGTVAPQSEPSYDAAEPAPNPYVRSSVTRDLVLGNFPSKEA